MKLFVDTAQILSGGGIQVAVEHHRQMLRRDDVDTTWRLSDPVRAAIEREGLSLPTRWEAARPGLRQAAQAVSMARQNDVVFTIFGPPRVPRLPAPHLCGYGSAWTLQPHSVAWDALSPSKRRKDRLLEAIRGKMLAWADAWVVETATAKVGVMRVVGARAEQVHVVGNTCGDSFRDPRLAVPDVAVRRDGGRFLFLVLAAWYAHKQLDLLPSIAQAARERGCPPIGFVLTLPPDSEGWANVTARARALGVDHCFQTVGAVPARRCPGLYLATDALFLPSLIETFSANYPEAMQMGRPILTSDLSFAREICGDAALFVQPRDVDAWAAAIDRLARDADLRAALVRRGAARVATFPDSADRTARTLEILRRLRG